MGLFDKILKKESSPALLCEPRTVYTPLAGTVIALDQIPDPVFSQGILGPGCGINPSEEIVYAPFDGEITQVADTKHAIGICSTDGMELLIHVGIDTVDMNGKGFSPFVKTGDKVLRGQKLLRFHKSDIAAASHPTTTAIILTNADDIGQPTDIALGDILSNAMLMRIK